MSDWGQFDDNNSKYKIKQLIGRGAFGNVYKAIDSESGNEVAIKVSIFQLRFYHFT